MRFFLFCILFISCIYSFDLKYLEKIHAKSQKGKFLQEKHLINFNQILKSSGEFEIQNGNLLWYILLPVQQKSKITKDGIYIEDIHTKKWQKLEQNYDKELILSLITFDFTNLQDEFEIVLSGDEKKWRVDLKPNNIWLKKIFKLITLSGKDRIEEMILEEVNGDKTINKLYFIKN